MVRLRIKGLVQFMNRVISQLAENNSSKSQLNQLHQSVEKILHQVKSLVKISYNPRAITSAYFTGFSFFILTRLGKPQIGEGGISSAGRIKTSNRRLAKKSVRPSKNIPRSKSTRSLLITCSQIQEAIEVLAFSLKDKQSLIISSKLPDFTSLLLQIQTVVQLVERSLKKRSLTPDQMSPRTLRAYRWLKSLSASEALLSHIQTVHTGLNIIN